MRASFADLAEKGNRFLVFGRTVDGVFRDQSNLNLPAELVELCEFVDRPEFDMGISSTELRTQNQAPDQPDR